MGFPAAAQPAPAGRLVLGLGNPGDEHRLARHNVGFLVVEELARRAGVGLPSERWRSECNSRVALTAETLLALPQTYMNRSGYAARCLIERYELNPESVLVVLDDVALPLGRLRLRRAGSPGGHRGLESVLENLQSDAVARLRLGVRDEQMPPPGEEIAGFVLGPFAEGSAEAVESMIARAADAVESWLAEGIDRAMARFNSAAGPVQPAT